MSSYITRRILLTASRWRRKNTRNNGTMQALNPNTSSELVLLLQRAERTSISKRRYFYIYCIFILYMERQRDSERPTSKTADTFIPFSPSVLALLFPVPWEVSRMPPFLPGAGLTPVATHRVTNPHARFYWDNQISFFYHPSIYMNTHTVLYTMRLTTRHLT